MLFHYYIGVDLLEFTTESITKKKEFLKETIEYLDKRRFMFEELWEEVSFFSQGENIEKAQRIFALEQCYSLVVEDLKTVDHNLTRIYTKLLLEEEVSALEEKE